MQVTIQVSDELAHRLGTSGELSRNLLEIFAADAYRSGRLSRQEVCTLLGLDYWMTEAFLAARDAKRPYTLSDLEVDRRTLSGLNEK